MLSYGSTARRGKGCGNRGRSPRRATRRSSLIDKKTHLDGTDGRPWLVWNKTAERTNTRSELGLREMEGEARRMEREERELEGKDRRPRGKAVDSGVSRKTSVKRADHTPILEAARRGADPTLGSPCSQERYKAGDGSFRGHQPPSRNITNIAMFVFKYFAAIFFVTAAHTAATGQFSHSLSFHGNTSRPAV
jgi:hypothetical protein